MFCRRSDCRGVTWRASGRPGHQSRDRELCESGWTDRDAVWTVDSSGCKEPCARWGGPKPPGAAAIWGGGVIGHVTTGQWSVRLQSWCVVGGVARCEVIRCSTEDRRRRRRAPFITEYKPSRSLQHVYRTVQSSRDRNDNELSSVDHPRRRRRRNVR